MAGVLPLFSEDPLVMVGRSGMWGGLMVVLWEDLRGAEAASLGSNKEAYEVTVGRDKDEPFLRRDPCLAGIGQRLETLPCCGPCSAAAGSRH